MTKIKQHLILIIIICITSTSIAKSQQKLSLKGCRQLAIDNNNELKIATEKERVAFYEKKQAFLKFFPKFSASVTYMHASKDAYLIGSSAIPTSVAGIPIPQKIQGAIHEAGHLDLSDFWIGNVSLTQPLFYGGRIIANHDIRKFAEELAKTQKDKKITDIIVEVDQAYWQVVSLANKFKLAESYVKLLKKMDSDIEIMLNEGVATKADRLSVAVRLNEAEMTLTKATNGLSLSKMLLCQLCGLEISDQITLLDEDLSDLNLKNLNQPEGNIDEAIVNRKELKSLELVSKINQKQEKIALAEYLPTAGLTVGYLTTKPNFMNGRKNNFSGMWNVGVKVSVPLNFLTSSSKVSAAKAQTRITLYQIEEAKEKIRLEVNQQMFKLSESNKNLVMATKNSETADENLRYANVGFEEGVISASDAMQAHTAWISAHAQKIDAQIDLKLCHIYLNKALGRNLASFSEK